VWCAEGCFPARNDACGKPPASARQQQTFRQAATESVFCIITKSLPKMETITMPKLKEQEQ
jgi:hypothetical protein